MRVERQDRPLLGRGPRAAVEALLGLFVPPLCWSCGRSARPGDPLCRDCRAQLRWLAPEAVELAGVEVFAPLAYEGPARAVIGGLKFRGATGLAAPMAAQIVAAAPAGLLRPPAVLVPVPLHPGRARSRGFNQAERLAVAIGWRTGMRVEDCLSRRGLAAARQVGRGRAARLTGVAGAVRPRAGARPPASAVLVDDVATTGATLAACAEALRTGGAQTVVAVAYALTPGR
jgi:ComF family protein